MGFIKENLHEEIIHSKSEENEIIKKEKIKLNEMIFNDIIPYLIYKKQFKSILEISLISKQSFKIIQFLLTHQQKQLKLTLGSIDNIKNYINNCKNINYKFKLLKFKEMEYLKCKGKKPSVNKIKNNKELKKYLKMKCPNLKRVHLLAFTYVDLYEGRDSGDFLFKELREAYYDYSENGFFSYDEVECDVSQEHLPLSNREEYIQTINNNKKENSFYNFSFQFLNHYQPRKLSIKYRGLLIYNLTQLFNFNSIESLYIQQPVTSCFIQRALESKSLKSLAINFMFNDDFDYFIGKRNPFDNNINNSFNNSNNNNNINNNNNNNSPNNNLIIFEESGDEDEEYYNKSNSNIKKNSLPYKDEINKRELFVKELTDSLKGLSNNSQLKKLEIRILLPFNCRDPALLFETIKSSKNQTLNKLSLPGYNITKKRFLSPLIQVPSISTLYFESNPNFKFNVKSFNAYLEHINENPNISKFKCSLVYKSAAWDAILERLVQYFKQFNRHSSILSIFLTFQVIMDNIDTTNKTEEFCKFVQQDCLKIQNNLTDQFKKINNNKLNLIFKS